MSYMYKQFGEGFDVAMPSPEALRFEELVELRGVDVVIVQLTVTSQNDYGHHVYSESSLNVMAMVKIKPGETLLPPGEVKRAAVEVLLPVWSPVDEAQYEVEVDGVRYHITGLEKTTAYVKVYGERKVD